MEQVDWVVIPSIWWENAPLVVQEAFRHRRPVICSGIGGTAEMVRDGIDGLHAPVKDPDRPRRESCGRAIETHGLWDDSGRAASFHRPPSTQAALAHIELYQAAMAEATV